MKKALQLILCSILLCTVFTTHAQKVRRTIENTKRLVFKAEMSRLWIDDAIWSRQAILCLVDRLPGTEETLYRLMINQEDMGRMFTKYYGLEKGDEFCQLISSNTALTISIIRNKSSNNTEDLKAASDRMDYNVKRIIEYLIKVNPNWSKEELSYLMLLHSQLFDLQLQNRVTENFSYDVEVFDKIITETYKLANVLSEGIIKQFPERFE
jgi:hypothetical protein